MSRRRATAGLALAVLALAGCSILLPKRQEYRSEQFTATRFDSLAVIAGTDEQATLQMTRRVREKLESEGVAIVQVRGLWQTELEAVEGICRDYKVHGVVLVTWSRLTMRECQQGSVAFDIQGGYSGVDRMTDRLLRYLRGRS